MSPFRRTCLRALAILNVAPALSLFYVARGCWRAGNRQENAGLLFFAGVLVTLAALTLLVASALVWVSWRRSLALWGFVAAVSVGLAPSAICAPFWLDAYRRSTTRVHLACSNLDANDPARQVAAKYQFLIYFALLHPHFAHEPDTRYVLESASGVRKEFRLRCERNGPCVLEGSSEDELLDSVRSMLPTCPPPRD